MCATGANWNSPHIRLKEPRNGPAADCSVQCLGYFGGIVDPSGEESGHLQESSSCCFWRFTRDPGWPFTSVPSDIFLKMDWSGGSGEMYVDPPVIDQTD